MNYIFDTNVIIGFMKNETKVIDFISNLSIINISTVTIGEMYYGARKSDNPQKYLKLYKEFFSLCQIFNISEVTSNYYSEIKFKLSKIGKPIPENDIWIAGSALEHELTIVTRDSHLLDLDFIKTLEI